MHEHFSGLAESYNDVRTTDLEPILYVRDLVGERQTLRAIDVGCGGGRYSLLLCQHLPGIELTLNDVNESMLAQAEGYLRDNGVEDFTTTRADIAHLDLPENGLDAVFSFNAIHHFDPQILIDKASRALTVGGHLFIYSRLRSQNVASIWGRYFPAFADKEDRLYRRTDVESWRDRWQRFGAPRIQDFRFARRATLDDLLLQARGKHYSTFSLYSEAEFRDAIAAFEERVRERFLDPDKIEWVDENVMIVFRKDSPGR